MYLLYSSLLSHDDRWTWPLNEIHKTRFLLNVSCVCSPAPPLSSCTAALLQLEGRSLQKRTDHNNQLWPLGITCGYWFPAGGPSRSHSCSPGRDWWTLVLTDEVSLGRFPVSSKVIGPSICPAMEPPAVPPFLRRSRSVNTVVHTRIRRPARKENKVVSKDVPAVKGSQGGSEVKVWTRFLFVTTNLCSPVEPSRHSKHATCDLLLCNKRWL